MKFALSLLLFPFFIFATVNEPWRCELFSGYRNDRIHWYLHQAGSGGHRIYDELYRNLQFWENGLSFRVIHRDIAFGANGSFAAFGKGGTLFQAYNSLSFTNQEAQFQFTPDGWAADTMAYLGYALNLTPDRTYKFILLPLFNFSAHFERIFRSDGHPNPLVSTNAIGASSFSMQSTVPGAMRQTWYGFGLGGAIQVEPGNGAKAQVGYTYHWNRCRMQTKFDENVSLFNAAGVMTSHQVTQTSLTYSEGGQHGQTGWAELQWYCTRIWRIGFGAQIHYFFTGTAYPSMSQQVNGVSQTVDDKLKLRWTSISGWLQSSWEL